MDLYLIRHAEAGDPAKWKGDDTERPLTDAGLEQCRLLGTGLRRRGVVIDALVSSPLVRAQQTAEGICQHWGEAAPELHRCDHLAPNGKMKRLARFVSELGQEAVGLVGHMPDLSELAGWVLGSRKVKFDFAKAGVARIYCPGEMAKGCGELVWLIGPEWLIEPVVPETHPNGTDRED